MKKILGAAACGLLLSVTVVAPARAEQAPPIPGYLEQLDGSDHGAAHKAARPDPQPDKGKDCLQHGLRPAGPFPMSRGGVNEDHCRPVVGGGS